MAEIIGIVPGNGSTVVYSDERGVILKEPSVMAIHRITGKTAAFGSEVLEFENRSGMYRKIYPFKEQIYCREMMRYFLEKALYGREILRPEVIFTVRCDMERQTEQEMRKGLMDADARAVYMYPRLLAESLGCGINISAMETSFIVRMGKNICEMALISEGRIVRTAFLALGGEDADRNLQIWLKMHAELIVSQKVAEHIKIHLPPITENIPMQKVLIQGRDIFTGKETKKEVSVMGLKKCLLKTYRPLIDAITEFVEGTVEPARSDVFERGLVFAGGCAMQKGLPEFIERETGLMVLQTPEQIENCAMGAVELFMKRRR